MCGSGKRSGAISESTSSPQERRGSGLLTRAKSLKPKAQSPSGTLNLDYRGGLLMMVSTWSSYLRHMRGLSMKYAKVASAVSFVSFLLCAQPARADSILISQTGDYHFSWSLGFEGTLAFSWISHGTHSDVEISVNLTGNGQGRSYLTTQIGPTIAEDDRLLSGTWSHDDGGRFGGWVRIFSGLTLGPG